MRIVSLRSVDAAHAARLRSWLDEAARVADPGDIARVRQALAAPDEAAALVRVSARGTTTCFARVERGAPPRRALEFDRGGTLLAALRWHSPDGLAEARLRLPDRTWLLIEPRASREAPWGLSDRLWHAGDGQVGDAAARRPLTLFRAVDYARVRAIPPLAEPGRLPAGAAAVVLNLLAALAVDDGVATVGYDGPYPGEQLFLTLLESFACGPGVEDPLAAFTRGDLVWTPAPHERAFVPGGAYVQLRERVEKVVWRRRAYVRPDWQGVVRHAPRRVRDVEGGVACSLWALGRSVEDHLRLDDEGELVAVLEPAPPSALVRALPRALTDGVVALVAALSTPELTASIEAAGTALRLEWGPVTGDLLEVAGDRIRLSSRLRDVVTGAIRAAGTRAARLAAALAGLTEVAHLLGDELRARAQRRLLSASPAEQAAALVTRARTDGQARRIGAAVEAMIATADQDVA